MSVFNEAQTAIAAITPFDAQKVKQAGELFVEAVRQSDAKSGKDEDACIDLILAWSDKGNACIEELTRRVNLASSQVSQANAYTQTGQTALGSAVAKGSAEGTIELCDNAHAFFTAFQQYSEMILKEQSLKEGSDGLHWTYFRSFVNEKNYQQCAETALRIKQRTQRFNRQVNTTRSSSGCYVATAVYGSYDCPQVWTLRRYRDYELAETWYGRAFIKCYYAVSPILVKWFGDTDWFKDMWRGRLDSLVRKCKAKGFSDTPYEDRVW